MLAADEFFAAYEVVGPLAAGIALYAIYLAMVVVLGRTGRTEFGLPATAAAVVVNIGLNLWLVPEQGIVGAAIALVVSYVVVVVADVRVQPAPVPRAVRVAAAGIGPGHVRGA